MRRAAKFHCVLTAAVLIIYLATALFVDPRFLIRDFREKFAQAATVSVSLRIIGPPGKPAVTATTDCEDASPFADLDWDATEDTNDYDINRNSSTLVSGLTDTDWRDENVEEETSYTYQVIANGPEGSTSSDDVQVTTSDCAAQETATCRIRTTAGKNVSSFGGMPKIEERAPKFTGTTNIDNADITITITGAITIHSTDSANSNGYWSWTVPQELPYGQYKIKVKAEDPDDDSYYETDSLIFKIVKTGEAAIPSPPSAPEPEEKIVTPPAEEKPIEETVKIPLELSLEVTNADDIVYAGKDLNTQLKITHHDSTLKNLEITYTIFDSKGKEILSTSDTIATNSDQTLQKGIKMPRLVSPGKYKISAKTSYGDTIVSADDYFEIKEIPLLNLGGGFTITLTQIMQKMSWVILVLLILLLFFLTLLGFEHRLTQRALYHITENILRKNNVISGGKGVSS